MGFLVCGITLTLVWTGVFVYMLWDIGGLDQGQKEEKPKPKYCPFSRKKCNKNCVFRLEDGYCTIAAQKLYELHNELNKGENKE